MSLTILHFEYSIQSGDNLSKPLPEMAATELIMYNYQTPNRSEWLHCEPFS